MMTSKPTVRKNAGNDNKDWSGTIMDSEDEGLDYEEQKLLQALLETLTEDAQKGND